MSRVAVLTILLAGLIVISSSSPVWAAQLDARINPLSDHSPFTMKYQKTIFIEYPEGGQLFDILQGEEWRIEGETDSSDPGVQELTRKLNQKLASDGSNAKVQNLEVTYDFHLVGRNLNTSMDLKVIIDGELTDYVITKDQVKTLVDLGWRGMTVTGPIVVEGGHDINLPLNILREQEPEVYDIVAGTEAEEILSKELINSDFILEQPMSNWHFLFDPTGINVDASQFGLSQEISGFVVSSWTMGESSLREGRQVERVFSADIVADKPYSFRSVQSSDQGNLHIIGFGALDRLEGIEIAGVTPKPPEGFATTSTGEFPVMIIYGMAGLAAVGGGVFFMMSNRALKNEKVGQQGIDPSRLVSYQTSASSGGYQTTRGESQLRDESEYQKTRSVYDASVESQSTPETQPSSPDSTGEATCSCASSAEMGSECDCEMQGSCICDEHCQCNADVCKENVSQMR